jgi:hypothetical protein
MHIVCGRAHCAPAVAMGEAGHMPRGSVTGRHLWAVQEQRWPAMGHQSREQSEHIALCHFNVVDTKLSDSLWITPSKGVQQLDPYLSIDGQIGVRAPMRTGCVLMCTECTIAGMLSRFPNAELAISLDRHIPTVTPSGMVAVGHPLLARAIAHGLPHGSSEPPSQ